MKLGRLLLAFLLVMSLAGLAYMAQSDAPAGLAMASAAERFLDSLTAQQRAKTTFDFDDRERTNWHFVPLQDNQTKKSTRKGLPLEEMSADQKKAALALLEAGTSASGNKKAVTIMSLESILRELERGGAMVRNPGWYFFTVFGKPAREGKWGWRVEGHHLALNFVIDSGKVTAATPALFGANPAIVKAGPRQGLRTLPEAEDLARELFKSLDADQRQAAYREKNFPEVTQGNSDPGVGEPVGLTAGKMTAKQQQVLMDLLKSYTDRLPADVAGAENARVREAGLDKIFFAYTGSAEEGRPHTYRIQGPTFVVEFLNVQSDSANNPANHIHSVWRHLPNDFGQETR